MRRAPWRYSQPKLAQKDAQACQQRHEVVYEKTDGACTSKSHCRARWNISPESIRRLCYLRAFVRWLLPPWPAFVLFERERGGGGGGGIWPREYGEVGYSLQPQTPGDARKLGARPEAARSMYFTVSPALARPRSARGGCRRHIFLKLSKAGAEVPGPCTGCCRTKPKNFMDTIALVGRSKTVLIS
jgi:hypothetical protein